VRVLQAWPLLQDLRVPSSESRELLQLLGAQMNIKVSKILKKWNELAEALLASMIRVDALYFAWVIESTSDTGAEHK
jgi:hypothetical protein